LRNEKLSYVLDIIISHRLIIKLYNSIRGVNGLDWDEFGLAYHYFIIFLSRLKSDPITFGPKNLDPYPTRPTYGSTQPDPSKIIEYLLTILILF
jgi:hypothetical protein